MVFFSSLNLRKPEETLQIHCCRSSTGHTVQYVQFKGYTVQITEYMYSTVYNFRMCRTCTVYRICSKLYSLQDVQNTVQFTGYTLNFTVYSICSTLYIFKIYSTLYRLWDIQCTLFCKYYIYSVLYSVNIIYTVHFIL